MKKQLFKNTSLKLAATYLFVVMAVSAVFSLSLYKVLDNEIDRNYAHSMDFVERVGVLRPDPIQRMVFLQDRADDKDISKSRLINELLIINLSIFVVGGALCYVLARRTLQPIEEAHEALERFTSDASHELRTPLTTMRAEIEVALMNEKMTTKEAKELLHSNLEEVDRLTHLSERLLMLARLEEGNIPLEHVDIEQIAMKAIDVAKTSADAKQISIESKLQKVDGLRINGDGSSMTELLVILLDNAVKYSDKAKKVTVKVVKEGRKVLISVADQGVGIAEEDLPYIFDRFYQADSSRTGAEGRGYGLGLSLAQKITHLHNGDIVATSKVGKGSTFTVTLPLV